LAGLEVALVPDADEAGRKAMAAIAQQLLKLGCTLTLIDSADRPAKWDIADHHGSAAELVAWMRGRAKPIQAPTVKPPERLQTSPEPGAQVYAQAAPRGSLAVLWGEYGLARKATGRPYANSSNVRLIVAGVGDMDLYYDAFALRVMCGARAWDDEHLAQFHDHIQSKLGIAEMAKGTVQEGVLAYAYQHPRHPVRAWLDSLAWDEQSRVPQLFAQGFGARNTEYTRAVSRCFMIGMVARIFAPGCKADSMPILEGPQGAGKSSALKILGGPYYAEIHESMTSKDFYLAITGWMLCEISELNSMRQKDVEYVKGVISTAVDVYRKPYGHNTERVPRQCVFAGTTNSDEWNSDDTGARRFWPIRCGRINLEWLSEHREQLFAEALQLYREGQDWWTVPAAEAEIQRAARRRGDLWEEMIANYCLGRSVVTLSMVADAIGVRASEASTQDYVRIASLVKNLGFRKTQKREGDRIVKSWVRVPT
jgi:hypothetical protein